VEERTLEQVNGQGPAQGLQPGGQAGHGDGGEARGLGSLPAAVVRAMVEATPEAVYVADGQGRVLYINPAHARLLGRAPAGGQSCLNYYAAASAKIMAGEVLPALARGETWAGELSARNAQGRRVPVHQSSWGFPDARGDLAYALHLMADLSGPRRAEKALRASQARYTAILEDQAELICRSGADGVLTFVNQAYCRFFGKTREELQGHRFLPPLPGEDGRALARHLDSLNRDHPVGNLEHRVIAPGGDIRWLRWTTRAVFDEAGNFCEYQSVGVEVTEQKRVERDLRASQARYLAILEDQTELICRSGSDGVLTFINEAYCRFFGKTRDELLGRSFLPPLPGDDGRVLAEHLSSLTRDNPVGALEHRVIAPGGDIRWLRWTTRAIFDEMGNFSEYQSVGRDVTERRQAQEALQEAHDTLEQRVRERTSELAEANAKLARVVAELQQARDELHRLSFLDGLTGVPNRRYFDEQAGLEWRRGAREGRPLAVIMIDIDKFKAFNDSHGHQAGDECLRRVAEALTGVLKRPGDFLARYGGEEFVAVLPGTDAAGALSVAEAMRAAVSGLGISHQESPSGGVVTVSLGVSALVPAGDRGVEEAVAAADAALYQAKEAGRDQVRMAFPE
jgi:diguanylate cyclase (GGDEF)-like protein/PAS domain S-box-containing protein